MNPWIALGAGALIGALLAAGLLYLRAARRNVPVVVPEPQAIPPVVAEVLAALRSGTIVLDDSDAVISASPTALAMGLVRGPDLVPGALRDLVREARRGDGRREMDVELPRGPFGQGRIQIGVRVATLRDGLVLVLVDDRTQEQRVEEIRRDFLVNVSHELKTPVGGLALLAEAVQDAADDPEAVERFASRMKTETTRLARLVSEIVELSRLQVTDTLKDPQLVHLDRCARDAVDHAQTIADGRGIELAVSAQGDAADLCVFGEADLLTTAIRNLVTNAIAYSEPGSRASVTVRRNGDVVEVAVADQGKGIAAEDQERVFERFYRVDAARSRQTGGTGLGLAIVKHVCHNHGGEVTLWSVEGRGSTFTIRIPAAAPGDSPARHGPLSMVATGDDVAMLTGRGPTERQRA